MRDIINEKQSKILAALSEVVDATHKDMVLLSGIPETSYQRSIQDLFERGLAFKTEAHGNQKVRISITMTGERALAEYIDHNQRKTYQSAMAPSSKINYMTRDEYKPPKGQYYRNAGNAHIPSRGACA